MQTNDWYEWRKKGLGSSDAPIVMGVSPWTTPYQLWEEKVGIGKKDKSKNQWILNKGHEMEPKARAQYEIENDMDMPPLLVEHATFPFLRASLDGYNGENRRILEIKFVGKEDFANALENIVPEKYRPQIQHQLLVTGAERVDYYSFDGEHGVSIAVYPDLDYCRELLARLTAFWALVETKTPPPFTDRDLKKVRDKPLAAKMAEWLEAKKQADHWGKNVEKLREEILAHPKVDHPRILCGGVQVTRSFKKGNVDYGKVPALKGLDLEPYRKAGSVIHTMTVSAQEPEGEEDPAQVV